MIITITPNPLLDYVIHAPEPPGPGGHRVAALDFTVGGKGINVARMLKTLGRPALALSFAGGPNGQKIRDKLRDQGVSARLVTTTAETRIGFNLVIDRPQTQTWWLEDGEDLTESEIQDFLAQLRQELPRARFLAMSGTIAGQGNRDFYRRVLETASSVSPGPTASPASIASHDACRPAGPPPEIYIDAREGALKETLRVGGFFLKHNRDECRLTFGLDPFRQSDFAAWARLLTDHRIWGAMITDGPRQALLWTPPHVVFFTPPPVREVSAVGSGDATLAGLLYGRAQGLDFIDAARWGLAAGAADAGHPGPCEAQFTEIERLLPAVAPPVARFPA